MISFPGKKQSYFTVTVLNFRHTVSAANLLWISPTSS